MVSGEYGSVTRHLGRLLAGGTTVASEEAQLLRRFAADGDEAAFEALVARHGPMVLATCRRMLSAHHDAEDAFQATFLVLATRAGSIRDADRLGPWLHGVARRVATRSRELDSHREARERLGIREHAVAEPDDVEAHELRTGMDQELARLPEKYRIPLVLCYLDGMSHDEAAQQLGWPVGTVRTRLTRGRERLRRGLTRRGLSPSATIPAALPSAAIRGSLISSTVRIASSAGSIPSRVAVLTKGALLAMLWSKFKAISAACLLVGLSVGGAGALARFGGGAKANEPQQAEKSAVQSARPAGLLAAEVDRGAGDVALAGPDKAMAEAKLKVARQALSTLELLLGHGEVSRADARIPLWERRLVEALRESGAEKAEMIRALESYLYKMRSYGGNLQHEIAPSKDGKLRMEMLDAQYRIIEAEGWLKQEKAR